MSDRNVIEFLRALATQADLLEHLKTLRKDEVITTAEQLGYPFTEAEWDPLIWGLESYLAEKRGEKFDTHFPLWRTMWGKYYLEFLVTDVLPSFTAADFDMVMTAGKQSR